MIRRREWLVWGPSAGFARWASAAGMPPAELARIDRLIRYVESRSDVIFMRNGNSYSSQDAAVFLRRKMDHMGSELTTAQQFVDHIASKSSTSGEPYMIRFPDGRMETSAKFLGDELKRMNSVK